MEEQSYQSVLANPPNSLEIEPPWGKMEQPLSSPLALTTLDVDIQAIPLTSQSSNSSVFNAVIADPLLGVSNSQSGIVSPLLTNDSLLAAPVVVSQEAANFSFSSQNTSWAGTPQITQLDSLGEVLVIPGTSSETVSIVVQWTFRDAEYNNEVGVFVVDQSGTVGGLSPGEQGFAQAALQSPTRQTLFNSGHAAGNWRELTFTGGSTLAFYLIQNGTSAIWLENNPSNTVGQQSLAFFSLLGANPDGFDHSRSTHLGQGIWRLNWEDLTGGGDQDFNDVVFNIGQPGILLPGQEEQTVPLTVELVDKEVTYQNEMGYFLVDAPDGKIGDLLPGDEGYTDAVLAGDRHQMIIAAGESVSNQVMNLPSGKYLGWYLVANGTTADIIQARRNNSQTAPNIFFSYSAANKDGLSHLHAQQDSQTWAWEDIYGGGDRDFNDLVFRFNLGDPMGEPTVLPSLSISNLTVTEGDTGTQDANFTVRLSEASTQAVTVEFATEDDTAKAGEDYQAQTGIVSFAPGELEKTISVKVSGDRLQESTESFKVNLANANKALISQGTGIGTILDNDNVTPVLPSLSIADVTVTEGDDGTQTANLAVRLSQASEQTVTVEFLTEDDTAKAGEDYESQTGVITFAPGEVERMIAVNIKGDRRYELTESFKVNLTNANNALIIQGTGIGTILDNDPLPTIAVQNTSIVEGDGEPTKAQFEVTLSEAANVPVTVEYETLDGTATVGEDYQSTVGSLTFAPGETRRFIEVSIVGDLVNEADEVLTLRLKNAINGTLGNNEAQGTIINDDAGNKAPRALGLTPTTVNENVPDNTAIAEFSTVDINTGDTHSYQLVTGEGDLDNNAFAIVGNELRIKQSPNFEQKATYQIRVRTTDQDGLFLEKAFTINIADINEAPTAINLSNKSLAENIPANSLVGTISGQDPDAGDSLTYEFVNNSGGEDNGSFTLIGNELRLKNSPNFEAKYAYNLRIKAIDKGGLSLEKNFVIQITDVNEAPFFVSQPILTAEVGTAYQYEIKAQDPDTNDILTISAIQNPLNWTKTDISNGVALLSQIPTINDIGQHIFEWKVEDADGLIATQNYTLAVSALLKEGNNFSPSLQKIITIPATPTILQFKIEGLSFDKTDTNSIKDAFEVELVDAQGNSLVHTIGNGKTAFFNITEGLTANLAPGVTYDANTGIIRVNLVGVQPNTTGNLVLRLVNNDQDTATQVRITEITLENAPAGTVAPVATPAISALRSAANPPNLTNLADVTGSMEVQYQRTTLNEDTNLVYADFNLKNIGSYGVNTNLLVAIKNISDPTVQVRDTDGVTLEGLPYYDFTDLLINGKLDFNQVTNSRSLVFLNPNQVQFTYDVVVLAVVNRNPIIQTQPELEIISGQAYQYDVNAIDPDLDNLSYRLLMAPQGMTIDALTGLINWQTATTNIGNQVVKVEVTDDRGGFAQQSYTLSIMGNLPNRPPTITSTPIVDARVKGAYLYDVEATDPDLDTLTYELTQSPTNMAIESNTGVIHWLPTANQIGLQDIIVKVSDGKGGIAEQEYQILVQQEVGNTAPIITSTPIIKAVAGFAYKYQVYAQDADNDPLTYQLTQTLNGLNLDSKTGVLSFTPEQSNIGNHLITIKVSDGRGGEDTQSYNLEVEGTFIFTKDEDWKLGTSTNINYNSPNSNQLQLNDNTETVFNYIWVSLSGRDAVVRINTNYNDLDDGVVDNNNFTAVVGEYLTRPDGMGGNPSRTTVDRNGDVWVGNRNEGSYLTDVNGNSIPYGSVTKISANVTGNNTSTGVWNAVTGVFGTFDRRPWTNIDGVDTDGGTDTAADSAILQYVRVPDGEAVRHLSVDTNNNVWVGGYPFALRSFNLVDGENGTILDSFNARTFGAGGYGGLIDGNGILWSASLSENALLRYDPITRIAKKISVPYSYGLGIDSNGYIWNTSYPNSQIYKIDPSGNVVGVFATGGGTSTGVTVTTKDNNVWIANRTTNSVTRLDNDGNLLASIAVGGNPTGLSVDSNGKVWVTNFDSDNVMRIDPATNQVDLTVYLGSNADPYNYSDMTGSVVTGVTIPTGTWRTVVDGGENNQKWEKLLWNTEAEASTPQGTNIKVEMRTANSVADLENQTWQAFASGSALNLTGRYAEIRATLTKSSGTNSLSPILSDIRLTTLGADAPNIAPIITSNPRTEIAPTRNYQYQIEAQDANGDLLTYSLLNKPVGMTLQNNLLSWVPTSGQLGDYAVEIQVSDGRGGEVTQSFTITVSPDLNNQSPVFTTSVPTTAQVEQVLRYQAKATDPEGDRLTYTLSLKPEGMTIDENTGLIVWKPTAAQLGSHEVIVRVQDNLGGVTLQSAQILVQPTNHAPLFTSIVPNNAQVQSGKNFQFQSSAIDPDNDSLTYVLASSTGNGMTIDATTGLVTWTPDDTQLGTRQFTILAADGKGGQAFQTVTLTVNAADNNQAPIFTSTPRTTTRIGSSYFYQVEATDPNGDALTYSLVNAPTGMTLEKGLISWQPTAAQAGQQTVTIQASDGTLTTEQTYQITVSHQASNRAPVITSAPNLTTNIEQIYTYNLTGQDPDGDLVFWSLDQAPSGMVLDIQTGVLRWQPQSNQLGQHEVIVRLLDSYGDYSTQTFTLKVNGANSPANILSNPLTRAAVNQAYTYTVVAVDPENSPLTYSLGRRPNGMTIDATGKVQWTPTQVGSYDIDVSVTDNQGATTTQTYRLEVGSTAINRAPNITSTPSFVANVGSAYQYQVEASDPDGQTLSYQLLESPQGMTIDAASGLLTWTTPVNGNYQVVVAVFDTEGLGVTQGYTLTAKTNSLPVIRSTPKLEAVPNQTYRYDLQAVDPDGDSLRYSLDATSQALGMTLDVQGRLTWTPNNTQLGNHVVTLTVTDGAGGITQQTFTLKVTADTTAPQVRINRNLSLINQGETVSFQVVATDNVGIANLQLLINDTPVVIDSNGVASFTATTTGVITAKAVALDAAGNRGEATTTVNVSDPTDTEAPTVNLDLSGIVNGEITAPVEIKGSVNDTNLAYYALEVAPADGSQPFKEMFRGTSTVNNGVLGVLDPTLLPNDTYKVRLVAYDVNGAGNGVSELLDVKGDLKLGNFQLSFTDLEIPVSGIPIALTRTYDTLTSNSQDDFGYGWRMEFRNAQVRTSLPKDELYEELGFRSVGFKEGDSVYITLPGGKRERFTFSAKPKGFLAFIGLVAPTFLPDDGVTSTLTVADTPLIRGDGGRLIPFSGGSVFGHYMPEDWNSHYTLTTKEGIVYQINTQTGDIDSITNRNGDVLNFSDGGIVSSNGQQVTFERDAQGRIVAAIDPMGNRIKYEYDVNGDLVKVTDRENNTTTFEYNGQQAHYLDKIIDPLGKTGIRNEYDENGRLTKVFNALGNSVQLEYNPDNSLYTTKDALGNATTYEYDVRGNIITEVDAKGGITRRTYDEDNNLLSETNPEGETSSSTYDSSGNKLTETDALGNVTRYTYNAKGDLLTTTDALGNTVTNTYDSNGNPTAISGLANGPINLTYGAGGLLTTLTTAEGTTTYEYDARGNVTKEVDPLGHETTYTYDGNGNRLTETQKLTTAAGVQTLVTTTEYNAKGDVIKVTDALGNVTQMAYDANGNKTQDIDALGRITKYVYSDAGQLLETIYPDATPNNDSDNPRTRKEYDAANRVVAEIDELGRRTEFQYDALGRLTFTLFPDLTPNDASDNPRTESRYDDAGRVIAEVDERGNITRYEYDALGRRTKTILPDGTPNDDSDNPQMVVTYDALGRQLTQTDPLGRTTQYLYDSLGRSIGQIFADQTDIATTYDLAGRVVAKTDQMGNKTQYEYNAVGQLTAVIDAFNQRTEYQYNELGNLISQKDALGNTTRYEYDGLGRRIGTDLPLDQEATMTYDAVGNVLSTTDFNGETIHFEYDERNRLLSRIFPDNSRVAYTYTLTGQRATETSSLGTISYSYDVRDNLLSRVDADGVKIEYSYDAANNRTAVKVPSGQTSYSFDEQNRLKTVTDPQAGVTTYTYDLAGNLIKTTLANGTTETREYDLLNRLLYLQNSNSNGVINSFRYTLDKVGNRLAIAEQDGRQSNYQYDALYRLLQEEIIDGTTRTISYTYDVVSNRLTRNDSLEGNTTYEYDGNDRLLKEVTNGVTTTYTYDNNGNTLTKTVGTAKTTYEWDVENRLVGADTDGDGVNDVTNEYDGDGVRIRQTVAGEETRFLVDKNRDYAQVLEEYTPSKIIKTSYIYGHDLISQLRDTKHSFYHVDGLGSTRALTDINGLLTDAYAYEAFGEIIEQSGNTKNLYLFAGEQRDPNLNLDYLRARYLDINLGRLYGRDPFKGLLNNSITLNKYIYANSNPIKFVDPSGLFGLASISGQLSIAQTLAEYQINFSIAGLKGVKRSAIVIDEVLKPANTLKEIGLNMIGGDADYLGFRFYQIGSQLTASGYGLISFIVSSIYFEASASSVKLKIFPKLFKSIQLEVSVLSGEITFGGWRQRVAQVISPDLNVKYDLLDDLLQGYIKEIDSFLDANELSEYLATGNQNPLSNKIAGLTGRGEAVLKLLKELI